MTVVGITGGIGSGKTTVANFFKALGIPVYIADVEAKELMRTSKIIKKKLIQLFGKDAYINDELNKPFIANLIFNNAKLLHQMNEIVHPKVSAHFKRWLKKQSSKYVLKEAAILFENGNYKECDLIVTVIAPEEKRISRVIERDNSTPEKVKAIIDKQWSDEDKIKLSDFVINNISLNQTEKQVKQIHQEILKRLN